MTDVENLEKIIFDIFGVEKKIRNKKRTNSCVAPLNRYPLNMFAYNFMNRLSRLAEKFGNDSGAIETICERVKNLGEATDSGWAGPYCELVALDFYSQFSDFFSVSYINRLDAADHPKSIPALNGHKEIIDIDLCLNLRREKIYTDVKSFNCVHQMILDRIFASVEKYAKEKYGQSVMIGADNLSSMDYVEVKKSLSGKIREIEAILKKAVDEGKKFVTYSSTDSGIAEEIAAKTGDGNSLGNGGLAGLKFNFKIDWSEGLSVVKDYSPFAMAQAYRYKFLDYGNKLLDNEYSLITMVKNPWFNSETIDFGDFNNFFYRSLARRTFMELYRSDSATAPAREYSSTYKTDKILVRDIPKNLAGIVFIDDNSIRSKYYKSLYSAYVYLNPNYGNKPPLTIRSLEKYFRNNFEVQIKDFDDFKWDNY